MTMNLGTLLRQYNRMMEDAEYHRRKLDESTQQAREFAERNLFGPLYDAGCVVRYGDEVFEYNPEFGTISVKPIPNAMDIDVPMPDGEAADAA